jgi:hypothetical protein
MHALITGCRLETLSAAFAARLADIQYGRTLHPWSVAI